MLTLSQQVTTKIVSMIRKYHNHKLQTTPSTARKSRSTIKRHQEDKLSKAISSHFPIKMIAILEWTLSNVQQNMEQLQTPTMGLTINKKSTTTEPPPENGQRPQPPGGLKCILLVPNLRPRFCCC